MPYHRPATAADVAYVGANPRAADLLEAQRAYGADVDMVEQLLHGASGSRYTVAGCDDADVPFVVWGVVPSDTPAVGVPWMIGTDQLPRYSKSFLAQSKGLLGEMHQFFPILTNVVDKDNKLSIRWLKWMGFRFGDELATAFGHPFLPFWRTKDQ